MPYKPFGGSVELTILGLCSYTILHRTGNRAVGMYSKTVNPSCCTTRDEDIKSWEVSRIIVD